MPQYAPEYGLLTGPQKSLVRKLGTTQDHKIRAESGTAGKGWNALEDAGWIRIRDDMVLGYEISFTLSGWERWCRQVDVEEGREMQPLEFD